MTTIDQIREQLLAVEPVETPLFTVSLDLRPGPQGSRPSALSILEQQLTGHEVRAVSTRSADASTLVAARDRTGELITDAISSGSKGFYHVGGLADVTFETQAPFRNSVTLGDRPRLFEFEQFAFRFGRPVVLAVVDRSSIHLTRVQFGEEIAESGVEGDAHELSGVGGRTAVEGRSGASTSGGATQGYSGGHSKNRVQQVVAEHRAMFAREAASELDAFLGDDEFLLVGPAEARAQLLSQLSPGVAERAILLSNAVDGSVDPHDMAGVALELAATRQDERANDLAAGSSTNNSTDQFVSGPTEVLRYLEMGQLAQLILHEDAVANLGTSLDVREHPGLGQDDVFENLIRAAHATSAEILFGTSTELLEQFGGACGVRRW